MYRGDDKSFNCVAKLPNGDPFPLTGAGVAITFTVRQYEDSTVLIKKTLGDGITITNAANGAFTLAIIPTDTFDPSTDTNVHGKLMYDVEIINSSAKRYTAEKEVFEVIKDVSHADL